jgi:tight adherence protein C
MLVIGVAAIAIAITLVVYLALGGGAVKAPSAEVMAALPMSSALPIPQSGVDPNAPLPSLYKRFAALTKRLTPAQYGVHLQHKLDLAGNPRDWAAERVMALKGIGLVLGILIGFLAGSKHGIGLVFVFVVLFGAFGFFLPDVWIRNLGEHRQKELLLGLPDAIDMMTVCVEAGLGFDSSLSRVARNLEGPVASEFARVLQEMQFGKARAEALRALVERTDVSELRTFVSSIIQSSELGISIGDVLREQAGEMRIKRRQRAEEQAQKLPVKLLFPLLTCMLPALFVVVLGPAVIGIVHAFSSGTL